MASGEKKIVISPVTRIEGHAKISVFFGASGEVEDARFHVNEFRGFEKFCEGRPYTEMPTLTPRICGICPVSHAVSSAKACEQIMRVTVPPAGNLLRRLLHLGQIISSHALSFFYLSAPDFILGWDHPPETRNIVGVAQQAPELARSGIRLRQFGQELSERITGKKVHAMGIAPGGMIFTLKPEQRQALLDWIPESLATAQKGLELFKDYLNRNRAELGSYAAFDTLYMGLVGPEGQHEVYDGKIRVVDQSGAIVADQLLPENYLDFIAERPVEWSYLKYPYFKPRGFPDGVYRVGPLARLNVASMMRTPLAQKEFEDYRALGNGKPLQGSIYYHLARLIETIGCIEEVQQILENPEVLSTDVRAEAGRNQAEGIGCCEAPRGILFHHYTTNDAGLLTKINLLIATGQNNPAMNRSILEVAKRYIKRDAVEEGALNRVEGAIRCYDPCLSCSTHAMGSMPMIIELNDHRGDRIKTIKRD